MKKYTPYIYTIISLLLLATQAEAVIKVESHQNESSLGAQDGSIDITATGTAGPFTFQWSHDNALTTEDASGLSAGLYTVTVTNAFGCETTLTQAVSTVMTMGQNGITYAKNGCGKGIITLNILGGFAPYNITWSDGVGTSSNSNIITRNKLNAGTYSVTISDYSGQTVVPPKAFIVNPKSGYLNVTGVTQDACVGQGTGFVDISVSRGTQPYTYQWSNGNFTQDLTNITGGASYQVSVTDANGCQSVQSFAVGNNSVFSLNETIMDACDKEDDGRVWLEPSGGVEPYVYNWNTTGNISTFFSPNDYIHSIEPNTNHTVTVTDALGCQVTQTFFVAEEPEVTIIDTDNCTKTVKCGLNVLEITSPQWDPNTHEEFDKDNCEMTVYCPLTQQNETFKGREYSDYNFTIPLTEECFVSTDKYCREQKRCEIYKPSKDKFIDRKMSASSHNTFIFPAHSGLVSPNHPHAQSGTPNCPGGTSIIEAWCGPQQSNGDNFIGYKCFRCMIFPMIDVQLMTLYQPDLCSEFPWLCQPVALPKPVITNVTPNPFYEQFGIQFNSPTDKIEVVVSDALGRVVHRKELEPQIGENSAIVVLENNTPPGMYFVTLKSPNGTQDTRRIVHLEAN